MKTSIDLPDDLYRRVKARSAMEGRAVREVATELFAAWVESAPTSKKTAIAAAVPADQWLYDWDALGARVSLKPKSRKVAEASLVDQLRRDRG